MASGNMKVIKRRIKSVGSTMQITKAMELVASSKLRHAKTKTTRARPFFDSQVRLLHEIANSRNIDSVFIQNRNNAKSKTGKSLCIVIAGERGLAGGYNSGMFKLFVSESMGEGGNAESVKESNKIVAIGKKSVEYFEKRGYDIVSKHTGISENVKSGYCAEIANSVIKMFSSGEVGEVKLFYTRFVSSMVQEATVLQLLPIIPDYIEALRNESGDDAGKNLPKYPREIEYDPSPDAVFNRVVPNFLMSLIQCAITESYASEQCARRVAMENASDNAEEMIENLSLLYNRARQEKITNEINEIVGGANAL
ncbi:MAG: ATP synthase F1 subunit gamma [Oscillospiraceae bacterium]|nr:ATP synthase F1 subunit gamma [Oscillospiraceae bacterium]